MDWTVQTLPSDHLEEYGDRRAAYGAAMDAMLHGMPERTVIVRGVAEAVRFTLHKTRDRVTVTFMEVEK